jgi:hypothetical protein
VLSKRYTRDLKISVFFSLSLLLQLLNSASDFRAALEDKARVSIATTIFNSGIVK